MVEYSADLNLVFHSLADDKRRDMLRRVIERPRSISELADAYSCSFAAVAKHISVLETANLVTKRRHGRLQIVEARHETLRGAADCLEEFESLWDARLYALEQLLESGGDHSH